MASAKTLRIKKKSKMPGVALGFIMAIAFAVSPLASSASMIALSAAGVKHEFKGVVVDVKKHEDVSQRSDYDIIEQGANVSSETTARVRIEVVDGFSSPFWTVSVHIATDDDEAGKAKLQPKGAAIKAGDRVVYDVANSVLTVVH